MLPTNHAIAVISTMPSPAILKQKESFDFPSADYLGGSMLCLVYFC
jgi:hypothetical protein